jgi:hypothetical protein
MYEMVLRRCHFIFVSDAGADPACTLEDLGNAVRKIRIDLGVPITFEPTISIFGRKDPRGEKAGKYVAVGKIHYKAVDGQAARDGVLIYVKPSFYGRGPVDVFNYANRCQDFPHESTADQFFSESQFESYRSLGAHVIADVLGEAPLGTLDDVKQKAEQYVRQAAP